MRNEGKRPIVLVSSVLETEWYKMMYMNNPGLFNTIPFSNNEDIKDYFMPVYYGTSKNNDIIENTSKIFKDEKDKN